MPARQLPLLDVAAGLRCAYGEPWDGPHPVCEAQVERACAAFDAGMLSGAWDAEGYQPHERRAQVQRVQRRAEAGAGLR